MSSPRRALLAIAATAATLAGALVPVASASAAAPPADSVFTYGVNTRASSDGTLSDVTVTASALTMTGSPSLSLSVGQPTDRPLAAGDVLPTSADAPGAGVAKVLLTGAACATPQPGKIAVDEATYDDAGVLQSLVARYAYPCSPSGSPLAYGEIRLRSAAPYTRVRVVLGAANPVRVAVDTTREVTHTVMNTGGVAVTVGHLSLSAVAEAGASIVSDGCSGVVLQPDQQCQLTLRLSPAARLTSSPVAVNVPVAELPGMDDSARGGYVTVTTLLSSDGVPAAPVVSVRAAVDGARVTWPAVAATTTTSAATSYQVHRSSAAGDQDWTVQGGSATTLVQDDPTLPAGATATYSVRGVSVYGTGDAGEQTVTSPAWDGPYDPARRELSMVWDEAVGGSFFAGETTHLPSPNHTTFGASLSGSRVSFGDYTYTYFSMPVDLADGHYDVGTVAGQLDLRADSGRVCDTPTGTADVQHAAASRLGGYASISVDADLLCADGHHLRAELRWSTPETVHALATPDSTVIRAIWGHSVTADVTVTNTGSAVANLGDVRLIDAETGTAAPFRIAATSCPGAVLQPTETCDVTVAYSPVSGSFLNDYAKIAVKADLGEVELGTIAGIPVASLSGPQDVKATGRPGHVDVTWVGPVGTDGETVDSYRVEELAADGTPTVLGSYPATTTSASFDSLAPGAHRIQVVVRTSGGQEKASAPVAVTVGRRWLLTVDGQGIRTWDPDGGTDGGQIGTDWVWGASSSPTRDGHVVVSTGYDAAGLAVRDLDGTTVRTLTGGAGDDIDPAVSPDGTRVVFTRYDANGIGRLMVVPVDGGTPVGIPVSDDLSHPSWTPDGLSVVASDDRDVTPVPGLVRVDVATGARTALSGTSGAWSPTVSRTGQVAYLVSNASSDEVRTTSLSGGTSTHVGGAPWLDDVAWDPTGRWLASTGLAPWESTGHSWVYDTANPSVAPVQVGGGHGITWLDQRSAAPTAALSVPAYTGRAATVAVTGSDPDDAIGGLRRECRLDAATTWTACGGSWSLTGLAAGAHTAYARVTDPSGQTSATVSRTWTVDATAPTAALGTVPTVLTSAALTLPWSATDSGGSGLASYDVRDRYASPYGALSGYVYPAGWQGLKVRSLALKLTAGYQYCFSARARDAAGNVGAWSAERCTGVALDDRAMTATSGWTRGTSGYDAYGTYSRAASAGVSLTRTSVQGRRIALVVTTCPTCGSVDVYHAGVYLGRVSLYSGSTAYRQLRWLPLQSVTRTGTVAVRSTSSRPVYVDGLVVLH